MYDHEHLSALLAPPGISNVFHQNHRASPLCAPTSAPHPTRPRNLDERRPGNESHGSERPRKCGEGRRRGPSHERGRFFTIGLHYRDAFSSFEAFGFGTTGTSGVVHQPICAPLFCSLDTVQMPALSPSTSLASSAEVVDGDNLQYPRAPPPIPSFRNAIPARPVRLKI
jgi:hypothetical protein